MKNMLKTADFEFEYIESKIDDPVLWESHCHAQFEMIAVVQGDVTIGIEGRKYRLQEGQSIIISPLTYHTITANVKGPYRRVTALFGQEAIPAVLRPSFDRAGRDGVIVFSTQIEELKKACQENETSFFAPLAQAMMIRVFYDALQVRDHHEVGETDEFLQKTLQYIDQHLCEKILLDNLAAHTSRSKSSFCHLFEVKMNISPRQYILQKKLALAKKMIGEGVPSTEVAARVGYDNYSNFYRMFLKHFGMRPSKGYERK